jgi:hypothetical protein
MGSGCENCYNLLGLADVGMQRGEGELGEKSAGEVGEAEEEGSGGAASSLQQFSHTLPALQRQRRARVAPSIPRSSSELLFLTAAEKLSRE